jgi:phospholipid/cholesterol/gamma-HCH transport system substrate-binding protein
MRSVQRPPDRRALVGLAVLVAAVLLALALWQRPNPFADETTVRAIVDDAAGLAPIGAEVRIAGTRVGTVSGRTRRGEDAELTLALGSEAGTIHRDARVHLRPRIAFEGTAYVDLEPGTGRAPALGDAAIPRAQTTTYVPLGEALTVLRAGTRRDVREVSDALARILRGPTTMQLNAVLQRAPRLTATLARAARAARGPHANALRSAVAGLSRTAHAVAARAGDLNPATDAAAVTARAVATGGGAPLDATLARLPATIERLRDGGRTLQGTVVRTGTLARAALPAAGDLEPSLRVARPLLREAGPALEHARPLLRDLRLGVAAAGPAAQPTRALLHDLTPTLDILDTTLLDALERKTALGTPAYLSFLGLFAGGGGASAPFSPRGDGHFMRFGLRFLTGVGLPLPACPTLGKLVPALVPALEHAGACTP